MKKLFCKFLSIVLSLTGAFQFFASRPVNAIALSEILENSPPTENCLQTMKVLNSYLESESAPNFPASADTFWDWCNRECVSRTLWLVLYKIISSHPDRESENKTFSFDDGKVASISLSKYIMRFLDFASVIVPNSQILLPLSASPLPEPTRKISKALTINILSCLDKLQKNSTKSKEGEVVINWLSVHRLFAVSYLLSFKLSEDTFYSNTFIARVAGLNAEKFNSLEIRFLSIANFDIYASKNSKEEYLSEFMKLMKKIPYILWDPKEPENQFGNLK